MANESTVKLNLLLDQTDFKKDIDSAVKSTAKLAGGIASLAAGTTILKDLGSAALEMSIEFEQGFAKVSTLFGDVNVDVENLQSEILALSSASGIAATELSEGLYQALSAGIPVTEDMTEAMNFLEQAVMLSVAGFTEVDKAVDVATTVLNAYGLEMSDVDMIMNTLIETQNAGKTTVDQLASSLGKVIPSAASLGVEFQELSAAIAVMTSRGVQTAEVMTQLKALFTEMQKPTSIINETFKEIGGETIPEFIASGGTLTETLKILDDWLKENNKSWVEILPSIEAANAAQTLMADGGVALAETFERMTDDTYELTAAYETMQTPQQNINKITESLKNQLIEMGNALLELVNPALEWMAENMEWLAPVIIGVVVALGFALVAMGGYLIVTSLATVATSLLAGAMAFVLSPVFLVVLGVLALVAVLIIFKDEIMLIVQPWIDAWNEILEILSTTISEMLSIFDDFFSTVESNFATFGDLINQNLKTAFDLALQNMETFLDLSVSNFETFAELAGNSWNDFWTTLDDDPAEAFDNLMGDLATFAELIIQNLETFAELIWKNIKSFFGAIGDNLSTFFDTIFENFETFFAELGPFLAENWDVLLKQFVTFLWDLAEDFGEFLGDLGVLIVKGIGKIFELLLDGLIWVIENLDIIIPALIKFALLIVAIVGIAIIGAMIVIGKAINEFIKGLIKAIPDLIAALFELLVDVIGGFIEAALELFQEFFEILGDAWDNFWDLLPDPIKEMFEWFDEFVSTSFDAIEDIFDGFIKFVEGVFTADWELAWDGIGDILNTALNWMLDSVEIFINRIIDRFNAMFSGIASGMESMVNWIPGVDASFEPWEIPEFSIPDIPEFASGGIVNGATLSVVGEAGPEMILPLNSQGAAFVQSLGMGGGSGETNIYEMNDWTITGVEDGEDLMQRVDEYLGQQARNRRLNA